MLWAPPVIWRVLSAPLLCPCGFLMKPGLPVQGLHVPGSEQEQRQPHMWGLGCGVRGVGRRTYVVAVFGMRSRAWIMPGGSGCSGWVRVSTGVGVA